MIALNPPEVELLTDDIAILHFWNRLTVGESHPAGPHQCDTLALAVVTKRDGTWRIQAAENVTLTDPLTGREVLRGSRRRESN
jgi:hypothetical protein